MTIADHIASDLQQRIETGKGIPGKLTLSGLSEHYQVSMTPVRIAIRQLVSGGFLEKRANGRLIVNPKKFAKRTESVQPPVTGPKNWDESIGTDIIRLSLQGREDFLREEATAQRYGVGRTVIRQVFSRLAGQGLIEHIPRCGWKLRPFREADMAAYLQVREVLELKALDLSRERLEQVDLEEMLQGNFPEPNTSHDQLDNRLHQYFIDRSENRYIQEFFTTHGGYYRILFDYAALGASMVSEMACQHRDILEAAIDKRWSAARRALSNHIQAQYPITQKLAALIKS